MKRKGKHLSYTLIKTPLSLFDPSLFLLALGTISSPFPSSFGSSFFLRSSFMNHSQSPRRRDPRRPRPAARRRQRGRPGPGGGGAGTRRRPRRGCGAGAGGGAGGPAGGGGEGGRREGRSLPGAAEWPGKKIMI